MQKDKSRKLVGIFLLALVLFNFPILGIFINEYSFAGIPVILIYLMLTWLFIVFLTAYIVNNKAFTISKPSNEEE